MILQPCRAAPTRVSHEHGISVLMLTSTPSLPQAGARTEPLDMETRQLEGIVPSGGQIELPTPADRPERAGIGTAELGKVTHAPSGPFVHHPVTVLHPPDRDGRDTAKTVSRSGRADANIQTHGKADPSCLELMGCPRTLLYPPLLGTASEQSLVTPALRNLRRVPACMAAASCNTHKTGKQSQLQNAHSCET